MDNVVVEVQWSSGYKHWIVHQFDKSNHWMRDDHYVTITKALERVETLMFAYNNTPKPEIEPMHEASQVLVEIEKLRKILDENAKRSDQRLNDLINENHRLHQIIQKEDKS